MSFWPLATRISDALDAAGRIGPVVEIGAGAGLFASRLISLGLHPILLDHDLQVLQQAPVSGAGKLCAEARELPFTDGAVGGIVLADVLRVMAPPERMRLAREAWRVLAPGASLVVVEDSPQASSPAEDNYRRALDLLSQVQDDRNLPVMAAGQAEEVLVPVFSLPSARGSEENGSKLNDFLAPLRWLRQGMASGLIRADRPVQRRSFRPGARPPRSGRLQEAVDELWDDIERDGMALGRYWFLIFQR